MPAPLSRAYPYSIGSAALAPLPGDADDVVLAAGTMYRHPIPPGARYIGFSFGENVRAKFGSGTVVVANPNASSAPAAGSLFNPTVRSIPPGATHLALIAKAACEGTLEFWG